MPIKTIQTKNVKNQCGWLMRVPHFSDCRFQSTVFKETHQIKTTEIVQEKGLLTEKDKAVEEGSALHM